VRLSSHRTKQCAVCAETLLQGDKKALFAQFDLSLCGIFVPYEKVNFKEYSLLLILF
jgi:hypothetical protein